MRNVSRVRAAAVLTGGIALVLLPLTASGSASAATGPHISANPSSVMVNHDTQLKGSHFPAHTSLTLSECSKKRWVVPQQPCGTNTVTVTTDGRGRFATPFEATTCPGGVNHGPGFSERCFIGEATPTGVDTVALVGAVKITVTGP